LGLSSLLILIGLFPPLVQGSVPYSTLNANQMISVFFLQFYIISPIYLLTYLLYCAISLLISSILTILLKFSVRMGRKIVIRKKKNLTV
jgi:hypothetical protein